MPSVYLYNCSPLDITVSFLNAPQQSPVRIGGWGAAPYTPQQASVPGSVFNGATELNVSTFEQSGFGSVNGSLGQGQDLILLIFPSQFLLTDMMGQVLQTGDWSMPRAEQA
jgi:hypothetical protein